MRIYVFTAMAALLCLAAPLSASNPQPTSEPEPAAAPVPATLPSSMPAARSKLELASAKIYVYDFLDIREDTFTTKVIDELERQLNEWLSARSQGVTILRSKQTPYYLAQTQARRDDWTTTTVSPSQVSQSIPVMEAVASNSEAQAAAGADHVLIVFPSSFGSEGVWRNYTLRFVLIRLSDGESWEHLYSGSHMVMLKESERSESRSRKIIDNLAVAMQSEGIVDH